MCVHCPGVRFIESCRPSDKHTSTDKILHRGTRCHGRCRENNQSSEVQRRKVQRREEQRTQHKRKINGRCLRRFSVALAKTGNGFTQRRRRNSSFLGKDQCQGYFGVAKQAGRLNVNLSLLLCYTPPFAWKNTHSNSINIYCLNKRGLTPTAVLQSQGEQCTQMAAGMRLASFYSVGRYKKEVLVAGVHRAWHLIWGL